MDIVRLIKEIGRGAKGSTDLSCADAECLLAAVLDQQVDELQLGALLVGLRIKSESLEELLGFKAALDARTPLLDAGDKPLVVIPSYNGARRQPNLMPLLALQLAQRGLAVLIHGRYDFENRVNPLPLMSALGIPQAENIAQANTQLQQLGLSFINLANYMPSLDALLATRARLGLRGFGHTMVKLLDPAPGRSIRLVAVTHPEYLQKMHEFLLADGGRSMLLRGTEGEVYANPRRRPELRGYRNGTDFIACAAEEGGAPPLEHLPNTPDNQTGLSLIQQMLTGALPIPQPLLDQCDAIERLAR